MSYGSLPSAMPASRPRQYNTLLAAGLSSCAVMMLMALMVYNADPQRSVVLASKNPMHITKDYSNRPIAVPRTVVNYEAGTRASMSSPFEDSAMDKAPMQQLAEKKQQKWAYDYSGNSVPVPKTALNFKKGTRFSPAGEFENDAMDKAPMQQLAEKKQQKWAYDYSGNSVPVPKTALNFKKGTRFSPAGEFENDAMDKAPMQQLAEKKKGAFLVDFSGEEIPVPSVATNFKKGTRKSPAGEWENDSMDKARMVSLAEKKQQKWAYDWSGTSVPVPRTALNFKKGTRFSPSGEFENDAMDKAPMQQLAEKKQQKWAYDYSGNSVPVPKTALNFKKGTRFSPAGEFENDAMDKARTQDLHFKGTFITDFSGQKVAVPPAPNMDYSMGTVVSPGSEFEHLAHDKATRTQALASGDAHDPRAMTVHPTHCIGDVCGDEVLDNGLMDSPAVDVAHADCNTDTDPECQTSVSPLLDKQSHGSARLKEAAPKHGESAGKADAELDAYFKQQQQLAAKPRVARALSKEKAAVKGAGPKHGESAGKADAELDAYFKQQQQLAAKPRVARALSKEKAAVKGAGPKHGESGAEARKEARAYFAAQQQQLAVYGVGALDDNAIEVGKAHGVDALLPETVFTDNPSPPQPIVEKPVPFWEAVLTVMGAQATLDEVNMAIQDQRNEGYTNGESQPAEDIETP